MPAKEKSDALRSGEDGLHGLEPVGRTSYEGGDGGPHTPWHQDWRAWPKEGYTKDDIADAAEDHFSEDYILMMSMTDDKHEYIYVAVQTI